MKVDFEREQFKTLVKMVYISNWVVNGVRSGAKGDEQLEEYENLEKYILSLAKDFGFNDLIDDLDGKIYPSRELEEGGTRNLIDYYDEDTFWEELVYRLVDRDFYQEYGLENIRKMSIEERMEKDYPYHEKYIQEIKDYGLSRLKIVED